MNGQRFEIFRIFIKATQQEALGFYMFHCFKHISISVQRICTGHSGANYHFFTTFLPCNDHFSNNHLFTTLFPPFTTFTILQSCRCKLAILHLHGFTFTNDTLPSLYNLCWLCPTRRLHGFALAFALSSIYFH